MGSPAELRRSQLEAILPVVDLQQGQVVHGIAGQRSEYLPIVSHVVDSSDPADVAGALCRLVGVDDLYVADLGALAGSDPDFHSLRAISGVGLKVWLDAGVNQEEKAKRLLSADVSRLIVALESLSSLDSLTRIVQTVPSAKLVFSLDLHEGRPVVADPAMSDWSAEQIAELAVDAGVTSMIVLDTRAVGVPGRLATIDLCRWLKVQFSSLELISGGGVRDLADVQRFVDAGCCRVLVASALHDNSIHR